MRVGDWKILATLDKNPPAPSNDITEQDERDFKEAELAEFSLYNLRDDIGETTDLAASRPRQAGRTQAAPAGEVSRSPRRIARLARLEVHRRRRQAHRMAALRQEAAGR